MHTLLDTFGASSYLLFPAATEVRVLLHEDAAYTDAVQGYLHAALLRRLCSTTAPDMDWTTFCNSWSVRGSCAQQLLADTTSAARDLAPGLHEALLAAGWREGIEILEDTSARVKWGDVMNDTQVHSAPT